MLNTYTGRGRGVWVGRNRWPVVWEGGRFRAGNTPWVGAS